MEMAVEEKLGTIRDEYSISVGNKSRKEVAGCVIFHRESKMLKI